MPPRPQLNSPQLLEDFRLYRSHLEQMQPGLYDYYPKDSLDRRFDQLEAQLTASMSDVEFYRLLVTLLPYIANGHNAIYPPTSYRSALGQDYPRFPFDVYWDAGQLYVLRNLSGETAIEDGARIRSINGQPAAEVLHYIAGLISRDGFNESLPMHTAFRSFKSYYAFLLGTPEYYELEVENRRGERQSYRVAGLPLPEISKTRKERYPDHPKHWSQTKDLLYTLQVNGQVATMKLQSFATSYIRKRGQRFKRFFAQSFAEIAERGVEHLIIDLRGNGGGDPEPTAALFAYLYERDVPFYRDMKMLVNKIPDPQYYDNNARLVNLFTWTLVKKNGDHFQARGLKKINKPWKIKNRFAGQVYVLTDPGSFSATGEMTGIIKGYDRATFIGEEAGGNPVANTSGAMLPLILPNSQIRTLVPIVQFVMAVDLVNDGHGVRPDHRLRNSIEDELAGRDAVMEYTLELIRKNQSK